MPTESFIVVLKNKLHHVYCLIKFLISGTAPVKTYTGNVSPSKQRDSWNMDIMKCS